jgi:hypothetical protein
MTDSEAREMARGLVRGSIIEDAAAQFVAQVLKEAHDSRIKPMRDRIKELEAKQQETFQMYVDANEARIDAETKLSESEDLLAKAVETIDDLITTYVWVRENEYERGWSEMGNAVHEATFVQIELKGQGDAESNL